jgi:Na+-translocating ferredoxin:NAD+ oxidoreductase RnfD subunit
MTMHAAPYVRKDAPAKAVAPPRAGPQGHPLHSGVSIPRYHSMHFLGALFPLTAGLMLYGWRAALVVAVVMGSAWAATLVWRRVGALGRQLDLSHAFWMAMLLALMLPAQLASTRPDRPGGHVPWPILAVGGLILVILLWLLGGLGLGRVHPVLIAYLVLIVFFQEDLIPRWVLRLEKVAAGDVLDGPRPGTPYPGHEPWLRRMGTGNQDSFWAEPASQYLIYYTTGKMPPERGQIPLHELLRDKMPALEDLIIGGHPAAIGTGSAIAVIIGGLFLLYRGLIDARIPLLIILSAFITLLILPVPTVIREGGAHYRWLTLREPDVRWETALTFVHYELMASPILFMAFFLATAPSLRPLGRRARALYACVTGVLCAVGQLYASVSFGPYVALLLASLVTRTLDRWFKPRPLV